VVMPNRVVEAKAAAGAGTEEGRRPTVVPAPAAVNPELVRSAGRSRRVRNCEWLLSGSGVMGSGLVVNRP